MSGKKNKKKSSSPDPRSRRFTPEQKHKAMELVAGGMSQAKVAEQIGTTENSIRLWKRTAEKKVTPGGDTDPGPAPVLSPGGLSQMEVDTILEMKKKHPSFGPAQVQAQLRRFKGWRISRKAIAKVFKDNGYELVHVSSRPKGDENPHRWEAPRRNAVWQMDLTDLRVGPDKRALAVLIDDFSRFVVGWEVFESPSGESMVGVLEGGIGKHGKPEAVYTGRRQLPFPINDNYIYPVDTDLPGRQ
jgi:transposase